MSSSLSKDDLCQLFRRHLELNVWAGSAAYSAPLNSPVQPSTPLNKPNYQADLAGLKRLYRRREGVTYSVVIVGAGQIC